MSLTRILSWTALSGTMERGPQKEPSEEELEAELPPEEKEEEKVFLFISKKEEANRNYFEARECEWKKGDIESFLKRKYQLWAKVEKKGFYTRVSPANFKCNSRSKAIVIYGQEYTKRM